MHILQALAASASAALDPTFAAQARSACSAPAASRPVIEGIQVEERPAAAGDLPFLLITDRRSGATMKAYYDRSGERAARSRAGCLGAQLRLLATETNAIDQSLQWSSVVFTGDPSYAAPTDGSAIVRWIVHVASGGALGARAHEMVVMTLPHEQVHAYQKRNAARLPRWLAEGHASWVGLRISAVIAPGAMPAYRLKGAATDTSRGSPELSRWGSARPKREAIFRQVNAGEQRRMAADPSYTPSGAFRFGPGDMIADDGKSSMRYEASLAVFEELEERHGPTAVRAWVEGLTATAGPIRGEAVVQSAKSVLGEDLAPRLE